MKVLDKEEFFENKDLLIDEMKTGKIFVYPTDTIYGIGCNALISESIKKMREIKKRDENPFSVIAPGKNWIEENCFVSEKVEKWLDKLPGPYTLILELKNLEAVAKETNSGLDSLGVRIPDSWFSEIVEKAGIPFVTTSVNLAGEKNMTSMDDVNEEVKNRADYIVYEGPKEESASTIVNLVGVREDIIR